MVHQWTCKLKILDHHEFRKCFLRDIHRYDAIHRCLIRRPVCRPLPRLPHLRPLRHHRRLYALYSELKILKNFNLTNNFEFWHKRTGQDYEWLVHFFALFLSGSSNQGRRKIFGPVHLCKKCFLARPYMRPAVKWMWSSRNHKNRPWLLIFVAPSR